MAQVLPNPQNKRPRAGTQDMGAYLWLPRIPTLLLVVVVPGHPSNGTKLGGQRSDPLNNVVEAPRLVAAPHLTPTLGGLSLTHKGKSGLMGIWGPPCGPLLGYCLVGSQGRV